MKVDGIERKIARLRAIQDELRKQTALPVTPWLRSVVPMRQRAKGCGIGMEAPGAG